MKSFGKIIDLLVVLAVVTIIPILSTKIMALLMPYFTVLDPSSAFMPVSIHHVVQILLTILLMKLYIGTRLTDWGFNLKNKKQTLKLFIWFAIAWIIYEFFVGILPYLISGHPRSIGFVLNFRNVVGALLFQGLISGTCEEPLFRGYVMNLLDRSWKNKKLVNFKGLEITTVDLASSLIFAYAHININFATFSFHVNYVQLLLVFVLGLCYSLAFHKTKSLLSSIAIHNFSNVIVILARLIPSWIL